MLQNILYWTWVWACLQWESSSLQKKSKGKHGMEEEENPEEESTDEEACKLKTSLSTMSPSGIMQLSMVSLALSPLPGDSRYLPRDLILYFVTSKEQPRVLPGTVRDFFLINPQEGPSLTTAGTLIRGIPCPGFNIILFDVQGTARGRSWVCEDTLLCKSPGKFPIQPSYCPDSGGGLIQLIMA